MFVQSRPTMPLSYPYFLYQPATVATGSAGYQRAALSMLLISVSLIAKSNTVVKRLGEHRLGQTVFICMGIYRRNLVSKVPQMSRQVFTLLWALTYPKRCHLTLFG